MPRVSPSRYALSFVSSYPDRYREKLATLAVD
jgi:hypothetical protein